jgi:integrase
MPTTFIKEFSKKVPGGRIRKSTAGKYYAEFNRDGRTRRQSFDTVNEAKKFLSDLSETRDKGGSVMTKLTANQVRDAVSALELIKNADLKISLSKAVKGYIDRQNLSQDSWTVKQCYDHKLAEMEGKNKGIQNARPRSITDMKQRLKSFLEAYGKAPIVDVSRGQIEQWLKEINGSGRNLQNTQTQIQALFNYAERTMPAGAKHPAGEGKWRNTVAVFPQKRDKEVKPAEIATPSDVKSLIHKLEAYNPRYAIAMALGCFAGLRTAEIHDKGGLQWEHIRFDQGIIHLPASLAKTRDFREVKIQPNLLEWLNRYKEESGRIAPNGPKMGKKRREYCSELGVNWPHNAARHSFGTYYAKLHGYRDTADQLGHTGGITMLKKHYSGLCTKEEAKAYFNIRPLKK